MEVLDLIDEIEEIVENASGIGLMKKVFIDKNEMLEIIKEIRIKLPDEVKQAAWVKNQKQTILAKAQKEAEAITSQANSKVQTLIDEDAITKEAEEKARAILSNAENKAREIRLGALQYADELLSKVEGNLSKITDVIKKNRMDLERVKSDQE